MEVAIYPTKRRYGGGDLPYKRRYGDGGLPCDVGEWALGAIRRVLRHKKEATIEPPLVRLCRWVMSIIT